MRIRTEETIKDYGKDNDESVIKKGINGLLKGKSIDVIIGILEELKLKI